MTPKRKAGRKGSARRYRVFAFDLEDDLDEPIVDVAGAAIYIAAIWIEGTKLTTRHFPVGPPDMLDRLRGFIVLDHRDLLDEGR